MYADDTSIYHSSKDIMQINRAVNEELRRLDKWLQGNKLSLNVAKSRPMSINSKQRSISRETKQRNERVWGLCLQKKF